MASAPPDEQSPFRTVADYPTLTIQVVTKAKTVPFVGVKQADIHEVRRSDSAVKGHFKRLYDKAVKDPAGMKQYLRPEGVLLGVPGAVLVKVTRKFGISNSGFVNGIDGSGL